MLCHAAVLFNKKVYLYEKTCPNLSIFYDQFSFKPIESFAGRLRHFPKIHRKQIDLVNINWPFRQVIRKNPSWPQHDRNSVPSISTKPFFSQNFKSSSLWLLLLSHEKGAYLSLWCASGRLEYRSVKKITAELNFSAAYDRQLTLTGAIGRGSLHGPNVPE